MVFQGVIFDSASFPGENRPKNDFEIFFAKRRKLFEPLYRVKGGPKCVFSGLFSLLSSFLARKCPKNLFEILDIFWSQTPSTPLEMVQNGFPSSYF